MKVFFSHSSKDKGFVRRLAKDLTSHGFEIWFDEDEIPHGASIPQAIQRGLSESQVMILFVSRHSVASKWVAAEWETAITTHLNGASNLVIPLRIDDSEVPLFLTRYRYSDFSERDEYEKSLSQLLRTLDIYRSNLTADLQSPSRAATSIVEYTQEILDELGSEFVSMPIHRRLMIIDTLKSIPRSGKKVRLDSFRPMVRIRTIYDHILSLAHSADCLLPVFDNHIREHEHGALAQCFAYHELNEVVLGDIPTYTSLSSKSRNMARILAEERLRSVEPKARKRIANEFIWMFLGEKHRRAMEFVNSIAADESNRLFVMFKLLDKIDPIVATWRYLHHYRKALGPTAQDFNRKMKDFYENPDVKAYITVKKIDPAIFDLVANLQDRNNAGEYYKDSDKVFGQNRLFAIPEPVVRELIEGTPLFHGHQDDTPEALD